MPLNYKFSLVSAIIARSFTICPDMPKFHQEICKIKDIFIKMVTVKCLLTNVLKHSAINKAVIPKQIIQTAEKK